MLKLALFCIGGNSIKVWAALATSCCTKTKRQNSYRNQFVIGVTCLFVRYCTLIKDGLLNRPRCQTTLGVMRHVASASGTPFASTST